MLERLDHLVCVVPSLAEAAAAYDRLGMVLTPEVRYDSIGIANRALFVGGSAADFMYLELIAVTDRERASAANRSAYVEAAERGGGAVGLAFGTSAIAAAAAQMDAHGCPAPVEEVHRGDGTKVLDTATVDTRGAVPFRVSLVQYPETWDARFDRSRAQGRFAHAFPLKRLDHLAAVAPEIEAATRFWGEVLGVPVHGEITTPAMVIRQLRVGDAILELLGPASPESPFAGRPAALASMAAWEVAGTLADAVELARKRGFTVSDPEAGVIPGTRRASIPAGELGGVGMQFLEYV